MIAKENLQDLYPLSPMQEGMLFQWLVDPNSDAYVEQIIYRLKGRLDVRLFEECWRELFRRHNVLRTVFVHEKTVRPLQLVLKESQPSLYFKDLSRQSPEKQEEVVAAFRREDRKKGFSLSEDVLSRLSVFQLTAESYEVIWSFHHIVLDGWSVGLVLAELMELYLARQAGRPTNYSGEAPYSTYIQWLEAQDRQKLRQYWRDYLRDYTGVATLPSSLPASPFPSYRPGILTCAFTEEQTGALQRFAQDHHVTLSTVMQCFWGIVLSRYNDPPKNDGLYDLTFGSVVSGRPAEVPGVEQMVGLFINTIPVRLNFTDQEPVQAILQRLQTASAIAQEHAYLPLADIQTEPGMIDHILAFENYPLDQQLEATAQKGALGFFVERVEAVEQTPYDLNLVFVPGSYLQVSFRYNQARYSEDQLRRVFEQLKQIARIVLADDTISVGDIDVLPSSERLQLERFNEGAINCQTDLTIDRAFSSHAARAPDAPALVAGDHILSYGEVDILAHRLADNLCSRFHLQPGDHVGVILERSIDLPICFLAILRAGGVYVPIDPVLPLERMRFIIADSDCPLIITTKTLQANFAGAFLTSSIATIEELFTDTVEPLPTIVTASSDPAYVIYTSGSTGIPKGTTNVHCGVMNLMAHHKNFLPVDSSDRVILFASPSFDASLWEICVAWAHGAALIVADRETASDPARFSFFIRFQQCTITLLPPSYIRLLDQDDVARLKTLVSGGEAAHADTMRYLSRRLRCLNAYGPSEASICATLHCADPDVPMGHTVPIGRPIPNTEALVLNQHGSLTPIGAAGELCLGGLGLGLGYLKRPDLTAERFSPHPFQTGERIYRTGDLVRWLDNGVLEFLGRNDDQVKIRGYRIELGEVEARLLSYPGVKQATVVARTDEYGHGELVGYVVVENAFDIAALRQHLRVTLPDYMVPGRIIELTALPLTSSGKVNRTALPFPTQSAPTSSALAPRDALEKDLVTIWQDVLDVKTVAIHDNFFDLGGHSLKATRIVARIRKQLGLSLGLGDFFTCPTVADLAEFLRGKTISTMESIPPIPDGEDYAISHAQQRLWILHQLENAPAVYNIPSALELEGNLDLGVLEKALTVLIRRHEALRTTFFQKEEVVRQQIHPAPIGSVLRYFDFSHHSNSVVIANEFLRTEALQPFDLIEGPLLRVSVLKIADQHHVLAFVLHHIICDGWSIDVIVRELSLLFRAFSEGTTVALATLPIQYRDFAAWQNAQLTQPHTDTARQYWLRQLAGDLPVLELPTDFPRPARQSFKGQTLSFSLGQELTRQLQALGRGENASVFIVLVAAVKTLLHRYSGQEDIIIGHPVTGREHPDLENQVGFYVNTIVLRDRIEPERSFIDLLRAIKHTTLEAFTHQNYPFDQLVEELERKRDLSRNPVFDVMVAFQERSSETLDLPNLTARRMTTETTVSRVDLLLLFIEEEQGLEVVVEFNTDIFHPATIARLQEHLLTLLAGIVRQPETPLWQLPLLTSIEQQRLLVELNTKPISTRTESTITDCFEMQVAQVGDRVAVVWGDQQLTYQELDMRTNQLASYLRKSGVGPDAVVGLCVDRSLEMAVGMLGILKAGGAYLPLDPASPPERLAFMLKDAGALACVTLARFEELVHSDALPIVCLDTDWEKIACECREYIVGDVTGEHLAYVMYTSGSTGKPKGVMVRHRNILNLLDGFEHVAPSEELLVGTALCPFGFDVSVWEFFSPLCFGGTLHVLPLEIAADAKRFARYLTDCHVTSSYIPAALLLDVAAHLEEETHAITLQRILVGVEPIKQHVLQRFRMLSKRMSIVNGYGPTEATVCSTFFVFHDATDPDRRTPIGASVAGYQVYLLNQYGQPVPIGVLGELYIGGAGLARGYLHRPALTAAHFLPDPFTQQPGTRLYKTGDLARYLSDGNLEFLGRLDHQVKIRGFRVEPGESEAVLVEHPLVKEAAVVIREDHPGDPRLVAYVVVTRETATSVPELRNYLKEKLPSYLRPSTFVPLDTLPRTPNGKINRNALPPPDMNHMESEEVSVAPQNPVEELLATLWADVLHVGRVGTDDNFFDRGGHSLAATRLVSRIREVFSVEITLRHVFEKPTIRALGEQIETWRREGANFDLQPIVTVNRDASLPLSFSQQRLWFLDQLEPGASTYNLPLALQICGALNVEAVQAALNQIVARHEALRTNFIEIDGIPAQVITPSLTVLLPLVDLQLLEESTRQQEIRRLMEQEANLPFDLANDALLRAHLLRLEPNNYVLLLTMHHIISDGWSMNVLMKELALLYQAAADSSSKSAMPVLEPLSLQYADFSCWQRRQGEILDYQLSYWRKQLADLPPALMLPTDHPRPSELSFRGSTVQIQFPQELTRELKACSRSLKATLFMTLLAAFKVLLSRYSGQDDIAVGTPIANRTRRELEPLIGFFANTLVLRTDLSGEPSFSALVERVRAMTLGAYAHQDLPFEQLVEALQPERTLGRTPLFQVLFILQNTPLNTVTIPGLVISPLQQAISTAKFDLTLSLEERDDCLAGAFEYNTDLFERATIEHLTHHLHTVLAAIVKDPETPISRLPLLTQEERTLLLDTTRPTRAVAEQTETMASLFAAQVKRTPDACAVEDGEQRLSYKQLEVRANQLAHHLRTLGASPNIPIGLCLRRSVDLAVGLLGILKTGAGCLPLDFSYPSERLAFMLADSGAPVVVTHSHLLAELPQLSAQTVLVDADLERISRQPVETPAVTTKPEDLLYILYTSGSTGKPKGVAMPHRVLANLVEWGLSGPSFSWPARTLQFAPISFDVSFQEIFTCWSSGGTLVLIDEARRLDARELLSYVRDQAIERLFLPFVALQGLAEAAEGQSEDNLPRQLKQIISAGEQLRITPAVAQFFTRLPDCELHNHYGPTESHVVTYHLLTGPAKTWPQIPPIGKAIRNAQLYVLDQHKELVPVGVPGELYIGGPVVADGYVNRPELTAERFIHDPFSEEEKAYLYRTGDRVRMQHDGSLEFLGRQDEQIKIRGFRVELGEIETVLAQHVQVSQAIVLVDESQVERKRLVAYIVPPPRVTVEVAALRRYLKDLLPEYMIPAGFIVLEKAPLTASGKLNRRALPALEFVETGLEADFVPPRSPLQQKLAALWEEVLGVLPVGIHDNFFELGGHSLLATQLMARIRSALSVDLPLRRLFEAPTIEELAKIIDGADTTQLHDTAPLVPVARQKHMPLSFAQERLWFVAQLGDSTSIYNMPAALRLSGELQVGALQASFKEMVQRHEILRTRFVQIASAPVQIIVETLEFPLPIRDLQGWEQREQEDEVYRLATEHARAPFDLTQAPLLRVCLVRLAPTEHVLLLNMHHIISDGWSVGVFTHELTSLYQSYVQGEPSPLPALSLQYADFAYWQRHSLSEDVLAPHLAYWKDQLAGAPQLLRLPLDRSRPTVQTFRGANAHFVVDATLTGKLSAQSRKAGVTLYTSMFSAYATLLYRLSGQEDFIITAPVANRTQPELEPLIGFFVNELPIRANLSGDPTFSELRRRVHATLLDGFTHQDAPFEKIVEDFAPVRSLSQQTPLAQVVFVLQNASKGRLTLPDLQVTPLAVTSTTAKYDLLLSIDETSDGLQCVIEYATDLFDAVTIENMIASYLLILRSVVEAPDLDVLEIPLSREEPTFSVRLERKAPLIDGGDDFTFE